MNSAIEVNKHIHPALAASISAVAENVSFQLKDLQPEQKIIIKTRNTTYTVDCEGEDLFIQGHPEYCPQRTRCWISGCTFGGSVLKAGHIVEGMYLEFGLLDIPYYENRRFRTSQIQTVEVPL